MKEEEGDKGSFAKQAALVDALGVNRDTLKNIGEGHTQEQRRQK